MLDTPILLITFNRPNHTRRVLERIVAAHPKNLYIFQDGARDEVKTDDAKCRDVRRVIAELTGCEALSAGQTTMCLSSFTMHYYGSATNLGCGAGPMTAISWFFDHEEQGIVMEDDCLAHPDFFGYSEELLGRYRDDHRVGFINSTLYDDKWHCRESYGFSRYMVTGAWASWRRVWQGFDLDLLSFPAKRFYWRVLFLTGNPAEALWWFRMVRGIQRDHAKKSYWDYQMQILLFSKGLLTIHPRVNLVTNIGFDIEATHTTEDDGRGSKTSFPILPLTHPSSMLVDRREDERCWAKVQSRSMMIEFVSLIRQVLHSHLGRL